MNKPYEDSLLCLVKRPHEEAEITILPNTLEALQETVGGLIEVVRLWEGRCIICNEEGVLLGLDENCTIGGLHFVGPVIIVGEDIMEGEFKSLPGHKICSIKREIFHEEARL